MDSGGWCRTSQVSPPCTLQYGTMKQDGEPISWFSKAFTRIFYSDLGPRRRFLLVYYATIPISLGKILPSRSPSDVRSPREQQNEQRHVPTMTGTLHF